MCTTGNQTTIALSTTGLVGNFEEIDTGEETLSDLEDSHLGSTAMEYCPADLADKGELKFRLQFNSSRAFPDLGVVETATITFPLAPGETTPATLAGSGYLKRHKRPVQNNNQVSKQEFTFKWDGKTGPTFTPST